MSKKEHGTMKMELSGSWRSQRQLFRNNGNIICFRTTFVEFGGGNNVGDTTKLKDLSGTDLNITS
jgi:hypothetical protein